MNFSHSKNIIPGGEEIAKICAASWSPNNMRLAIATSNKKILLFDENGAKKDAFSTKGREKNKEYVIREIVFSPDSTKLAIAQSDNIIFVYKLGARWGDTKSICNKLEQPSSVMCMIWSRTKGNEIFFGLTDGKIKIGLLGSKNSSSVLYSYEFPALSIATSLDGKFIISGHADNVILKYNLENSIWRGAGSNSHSLTTQSYSGL